MRDDDSHDLDHLDQVEDRILQEYTSWYEAWWQAWEWCETQGYCDGIGGHEFARVTAEARVRGVAYDQTSMRLFIRARATWPATPSITEESLARRKRRAKEKTGGEHAD
jgi:hypothetical protein